MFGGNEVGDDINPFHHVAGLVHHINKVNHHLLFAQFLKDFFHGIQARLVHILGSAHPYNDRCGGIGDLFGK